MKTIKIELTEAEADYLRGMLEIDISVNDPENIGGLTPAQDILKKFDANDDE